MEYNNYFDLLRNNEQWVNEKLGEDSKYFDTISGEQHPPFFFIGCSDSRLPLNTFTKTEPGELFIHRNIANQCLDEDITFLSALEFALEVLGVKHVIVAGHYNCGGVAAATTHQGTPQVLEWVQPLRQLYLDNQAILDGLGSDQEKHDKLAELNVLQQLRNIQGTYIWKNALKLADPPLLHGWILNIRSGKIIELKTT